MKSLLTFKRVTAAMDVSASDTQARIDGALSFLNHTEPSDGFKARLQSKIEAAAGQREVSGFSARIGWKIAASILAVALTAGGLITHFHRPALTVAPMPAMHQISPAGIEAAGAVRVPSKATGATEVSSGRSAHLRNSGRGTPSRRALLPRGVAVPAHSPTPADPQPEAAADSDAR